MSAERGSFGEMLSNTRDDDSQHDRYRLSRSQLLLVIDQERKRFGRDHRDLRRIVPPTSDRKNAEPQIRFPNELAALRAYARAATRLAGNSSAVWSTIDRMSDQLSCGSRTGSEPQLVSCRERRRRSSETSFGRALEDYVDVGMRIRLIQRTRMDLLLAYYVLGYPAKELAAQYEINTAALGGRLGQARTVLRRALRDILPAAAGSNGTADTAICTDPVDPIEERRRKVARLLKRKLSSDIGQQGEGSDGFEAK